MYTLYATTDNGDGYTIKLGEHEDVDDIELRVGAFSKDVVITIEYKKT